MVDQETGAEPEIVAVRDFNRTTFMAHWRDAPNREAEFAMRLIQELGKTGFDVDGEDSSGRAKGRRMRPTEIVAFCCDTASEAFAAFRERGWMIDLPAYEQLHDMWRAEKERN